jgi:hypothetical protein
MNLEEEKDKILEMEPNMMIAMALSQTLSVSIFIFQLEQSLIHILITIIDPLFDLFCFQEY